MKEDPHAHKVLRFISNAESSFNIIDCEWLVEGLDTRFLDAFGKGLLIAEKTKIKRLITKYKKEPNEEDRKMYLNLLNQLIDDCGDSEYCLYMCY